MLLMNFNNLQNWLKHENIPENPTWRPAETQEQQQRGEHTHYLNPAHNLPEAIQQEGPTTCTPSMATKFL